MSSKITTQEIEIGGRILTLEQGRFAEQANSSIVARYGDTMVLATVVAAPLLQELDYFPLTVDYVERLYAGGRIKGSRWVKREGRPLDEHILNARLIDRSIRPLFPKSYKKEVQVVATVLSVDLENDPSVLAMIAVSAALATSSIPWDGPVGSVRVGLVENVYVVNPVESESKFSDLDLVVTGNEDAIFMIEAGARQVPEDRVLGALEFGQKEAQKIISGIKELVNKVGREKEKFEEVVDPQLARAIESKFGKTIEDFARANAQKEFADSQEIKKAISEETGEVKASIVSAIFEKVMRQKIRDIILSGSRLDGRKQDEVRPISTTVGVLPRTHGSAVFQRGQTQVLTATTLGAPSLEQTIESATGEEAKRYIHHYSMPPYSVGETGRIGAPSRREIGHGALAERALLAVVPSEEKFPYTIQVVSEVMSSNGSTSMASVCASTMSLMDAGVPIESPVAGVAMGLVIEGDKVVVLTDILGVEDGAGDMDFKVAGTSQGVTAIQLDVKTPKLTLKVLEKALEQAREGRLFILDKILATIDQPRSTTSTYAPKIAVVKIPVEKIGELIGPGGRVIRKIMADTGTQIDIEDDGVVTISGVDQDSVDQARERVEGLTKEVQAGEIYDGEVVRIQPFGAFVQILPGKDGLVHVSDMAEGYVEDPSNVVQLGDKVKVRVKEIDNLGRINLSMRMDPGRDREGEGRGHFARRQTTSGFAGHQSAPGFGGGMARQGRERRFGGRREEGRGRGEKREGVEGRREGPGGPHFPASRLVPSKRRF
ncbi:MAG: polyribonucleotide nucleotidyltransferase [Candidatus Blackburnbacteria bacterium]|nr:polyribonucleotide nucleotidyltransferase [Candidatus Blackburnbacteria bacterium]